MVMPFSEKIVVEKDIGRVNCLETLKCLENVFCESSKKSPFTYKIKTLFTFRLLSAF